MRGSCLLIRAGLEVEERLAAVVDALIASVNFLSSACSLSCSNQGVSLSDESNFLLFSFMIYQDEDFE